MFIADHYITNLHTAYLLSKNLCNNTTFYIYFKSVTSIKIHLEMLSLKMRKNLLI